MGRRASESIQRIKGQNNKSTSTYPPEKER